jgi:uncharacterized Zn finger protein (UPF0148 family)
VRLFDQKLLPPHMSDFDREAAREELREKFERDERKRESTKRMSELLLKGATMTNRHCDTCGDPIFRYQDQEFCATCQNASIEVPEESAADEGAAASADATANATTEAPTSADASAGDTPTAVDGESAEAAPRAGDADVPVRTPEPARERSADPSERAAQAGGASDVAGDAPGARESGAPVSPAPSRGEDGLAAARSSLVRTLERYSAAAEEADDPRRARELLSVAREAAETLSALDRTR